MMLKRLKPVIALALASAVTMFLAPAVQAEFPEKPITMYVAFAPGGSMDSSARALAAGAEQILGQPIVIVNKDGGGGTVGLGVLAGDPPDGYHLAAATSTGILRIPLQRSVPYKPLADFTPIFGYAAVVTALVVQPDSEFNSLKDLVEYARANPGKVTYGTAGAGTPMHLAMEIIAMQEKIKWIHVPFKGSAPAETALLGGHVVAVSTGDMDKALTGQLKPLAVHTKERLKRLPDVPTLMELGYNYWNDTIFAIYGPAGMDKAIVKKLEDAFAKAVDMPKSQTVSEQFLLQAMKMGSDEYTAFLAASWPIQEKLLIDLNLIKARATEPR
jgi:tripartite-type tricarboxylate transporter receptor subunit TctC